ncbi:MAG: glycerophosphodiester phosphodiesterase [Micromonosporaceae bacterium]
MPNRYSPVVVVAMLAVVALVVAIGAVSRGRADAAERGDAERLRVPGTWDVRGSVGPSDRSGVTRVAHRGASGHAPENTIPAVELGIRQHADLVEVDVQLTRDGVLVVMHDTTLKRTTDVETYYPRRGPWRVKDFTYREIKQLDAGSWYGKEYAGTRVPTLQQVLDTLADSTAGLLLEVKAPKKYPGIGAKVAAALAEWPAWRDQGRRVVVCSFDWKFIKRFHTVMPSVETAVIGTPSLRELPRIARYADQVNPQFGSVDAAYLQRVHELGMDSYGWTVDEPEDMRTLIELGSDGVITNKPDVLDELLYPSRPVAA